jgi:hypothetical protein
MAPPWKPNLYANRNRENLRPVTTYEAVTKRRDF